jgi:hypothetical protein
VDCGSGVVRADVNVGDEEVHQGEAAAAEALAARNPPLALVGDGDEDAVAGAVSVDVDRSRGVGVVGVCVFGGVGDRLVGGKDQVVERLVGYVESEPRGQFVAEPGGILGRCCPFGAQRRTDIDQGLAAPAGGWSPPRGPWHCRRWPHGRTLTARHAGQAPTQPRHSRSSPDPQT